MDFAMPCMMVTLEIVFGIQNIRIFGHMVDR